MRQQRPVASPAGFEQEPRELLDRAVEAVDDRVDLDPVAGRDDGGLGDVLAGGDGLHELGYGVPLGRDLLEQRDRGGVVADADDQDAHASTSAAASPAGSATGPVASPACLRCSW